MKRRPSMRDRSHDLLYALLFVGALPLGALAEIHGREFFIALGGVCAIALAAVGLARLIDLLAGEGGEHQTKENEQ